STLQMSAEAAIVIAFELTRCSFGVGGTWQDGTGPPVQDRRPVGAGVVPEHASGRLYRDLLGSLNTRVATVCDEVCLVVAGRCVPL
ncbi:MAG: bifunctional adenosylcobinamide kinase/adenosylcobinamide-phosphate guanylyltransferase, partial [Candidatus Nanopelagicales bacterium]